MTSVKTKPLNRLEVWVAENAVPIFAVIALAIILGAVAVFVTYRDQSSIAERVKVLSPQVTRVNKAICDKQSLNHAQRAERCAERIRVGLVNCRHSEPCRAAFLAILTYPPKARPGSPSQTTAITAPSSRGVMPQTPHTGHQQPGPGNPGPSHGNHGQGATPAPPLSPSPAPSASAAPEASPPPETPGNGAQGGSTSGAGVEVCALERCVEAEAGLGN